MGDEEGGPSKKRVAGRQISKDHPESDDDTPEPEMGMFKKASEEVMATRRIVKVRRNASASVDSSNPFAGISLVPSSNPFAGISLVPSKDSTSKPTDPSPQGQNNGEGLATEENKLPETSIVTEKNEESEDKSVVGEVDRKDANGAKVDNAVTDSDDVKSGETTDAKTLPAETTEHEQGETPNATDGDQEDAEKEAGETENVESETEKDKLDEKKEDSTVTTGPFSSFKQLSSSQNAFTGFSGTGFSTTSFGFGSFATGASSLGASSGSLFGFNSENGSPSVNGNSLSAPPNSSADTAAKNGKLVLQEVPIETGEENEKAVFTADAILFEYLDGGWKERGKGELKLNVSVDNDGKARLVMRARGNYRLILNASLYPDMVLTNMEKRGITFACVNSAGEANSNLATYALKFKDSSFVEELSGLVELHKGKRTAETAVNPSEGAEDQV